MPVKVTIRNLTKCFGATAAVHGLSIDIQPGEFLSLLGPSGCGKTTTLRMVAGLIDPDEGEILVDGRRFSSPGQVVRPEKRGMSMIFQNYALWPHMTVYDNVAYGVKLKHRPRGDNRKQIMDMLAVVQMADFAERFPGELSGGQQQRVGLARALAVEPSVLLMDEPLSNLDANLREEMRVEIRRLHTEFAVTTLYVTHDLTEAMVVSDRIVVMQRGQIEQVGTPEEIYDEPATSFVAGFIGKTNFMRGVVGPDGSIQLGAQGTTVRVSTPTPLEPGAEVTVALRPHDLVLSRQEPRADPACTVVSGRVEQHVFLGETREYWVRVEALSAVVRVVARPDERYAPTDQVFIMLPNTRCKVVAR